MALSKDGGQIDSITGATITTEAIVDGIREDAQEFLSKPKR